jgi:murein DD-endopeptidase MepM/ murein hydrolase activator NlpD
VAALQVVLWERGVYFADVDGVYGISTADAVRALQPRLGLPATGVFDSATRGALGAFARHALGSRVLGKGAKGWDVADLQFRLAWHGFPSGVFNGRFTAETAAALRRFEAWAGLTVDGFAGPAVLAALQLPVARSPVQLAWPLAAPIGSPFGPRWNRFHAGVDLVAAEGTPVDAAGAGRVVWAGWRDGGWGNEVTIAHDGGVRSIYAHLSSIDVTLGQQVDAGQAIGLVGATGDATGPHLHFELRLRGAAIDPLTALPPPPVPPVPSLEPGGAEQ